MDKRSAKKNIRRRVFSSDPTKLIDEVVNLCDAIENHAFQKGDKGDPGEPGQKPIAGVDYQLPEDGEPGPPGPQGPPGPAGHSPVAGLDYRIPQDGNDGITPEKGVDYFDGDPGMDGSPDTAEQVRQKLESLKGDQRLDSRAIKGLDKRDDKIVGDFRKNLNELLRQIPIGGVSDFKQLHDVPQTYVGQAGKTVQVKSTEDGLQFSSVPSTGTLVDNEIVAGSGTAWTLANVPIVGSEHLFGERLRLYPGASPDYTISGVNITTTLSYNAGDLLCDYRK